MESQRKAIKADKEPIRAVAREALGRELADKWLKACTHVKSFRVRGAGKKCKRSARAEFCPTPQREEDDRCVRYATLWLFSVLERLPVGKRRAMHQRLWLGCGRKVLLKDGAGSTGTRRRKYDYWGLAGRVGRSPRELQRYLAIARSAGILDDWQAKGSDVPANLRGRVSGHAYATYELCGEVPRELAAHLAAHASDPRSQPQEEKPRAAPTPPAARVPWSPESAARTARLLLSGVPPPPDIPQA